MQTYWWFFVPKKLCWHITCVTHWHHTWHKSILFLLCIIFVSVWMNSCGQHQDVHYLCIFPQSPADRRLFPMHFLQTKFRLDALYGSNHGCKARTILGTMRVSLKVTNAKKFTGKFMCELLSQGNEFGKIIRLLFHVFSKLPMPSHLPKPLDFINIIIHSPQCIKNNFQSITLSLSWSSWSHICGRPVFFI